ncbi:MAG TPA: ABC transporter substrate-binding protein [Ktedonobacteraceae bacterium]
MLTTLMLLLAACGGQAPTTTQSKNGGDISVGINSDVVTLDPLNSSALVDEQVMFNVYDTLVRVDQNNNLIPDLATSWSQPTPKEWDFTLRTDVKFQDGTPFNADAVVFNINRILSTPSSPRYSEMSNVQSVMAIDASHVRFNLKQPFAALLATLADRSGMILSPTTVKKLGANLANAPVNAGSGPFEFSEWVRSDHLTFKRNPHYWQKDAQGNSLPYLTSIRYRPITDRSVEFANLQAGTITAADGLNPSDVAAARANPSLTYKQIPGLSFSGIEINTKAAPFDNPAVRRAIEWGVNRQELVNIPLKGIATVAQGPIAASSWAYDSHFAPYTYDISKAKAALAQGGKASGITFTLLIGSGSPLTTQIAQFIQSELQPAGIKMEIKQETFAAILSDTQSHNYQAALLGWSGMPDPDENIYSFFHTGGGFNRMQYSSPQVDNLLEAARGTTNQQERASDYQKVQQIIGQDAPYIFIYHGVAVQATSAKLKNFTVLPTGILSFTNVYLGS